MPELISQRAYAKQKGWSHVYVGKLVKQGKIPSTGGKIDPELANAALGKTTQVAAPAAAAPAMSTSYIQARTFNETYKAKKEKLRYERMIGELVSIQEVKAAQIKVNAIIRAKLLALPTKLAPLLGTNGNRAKVKAILETEIREVLTALSETGAVE